MRTPQIPGPVAPEARTQIHQTDDPVVPATIAMPRLLCGGIHGPVKLKNGLGPTVA